MAIVCFPKSNRTIIETEGLKGQGGATDFRKYLTSKPSIQGKAGEPGSPWVHYSEQEAFNITLASLSGSPGPERQVPC